MKTFKTQCRQCLKSALSFLCLKDGMFIALVIRERCLNRIPIQDSGKEWRRWAVVNGEWRRRLWIYVKICANQEYFKGGSVNEQGRVLEFK